MFEPGPRGNAARSGVRVGGVIIGGPAQQAGVRPGDVIVAIGDRPTPNPEAFRRAVAELAPDATVRVELRRDGQPATVTAVLGQRRDDPRLRVI